MSEPLEHAMLFDLEPTELVEEPVEQAVVEQDADAAGQGALDIGIAIPTPFAEPS